MRCVCSMKEPVLAVVRGSAAPSLFRTLMNGCSALRVLLTCTMCMAPSASVHVSVYPRSLGNLLLSNWLAMDCTSHAPVSGWSGVVSNPPPPPPRGGGAVTLATAPPPPRGWGGTVVLGGGDGYGGGL